MIANGKALATLLGYSSLLIWAMSAVLVALTRSIPLFEILTLVYAISFSLTAITLTIRKRWYRVKQPMLVWIIGVLGIYGNEILYLASFKFAPPVQADLINYLWPILVVLLYQAFSKEKFNIKHYLALSLGFLGIYLLLTDGKGWTGFKIEYIFGYALAFAAAVVWSIYIVAIRLIRQAPVEMTGMFYGVGMFSSLLLHLGFEHTVLPTVEEGFCLVLMGLTAQGVAYFLWNYGIKYGNFQLLAILSYGNPIISITCLYLFGFAHLSMALLGACLLVSVACLIGYFASRKVVTL